MCCFIVLCFGLVFSLRVVLLVIRYEAGDIVNHTITFAHTLPASRARACDVIVAIAIDALETLAVVDASASSAAVTVTPLTIDQLPHDAHFMPSSASTPGLQWASNATWLYFYVRSQDVDASSPVSLTYGTLVTVPMPTSRLYLHSASGYLFSTHGEDARRYDMTPAAITVATQVEEATAQLVVTATSVATTSVSASGLAAVVVPGEVVTLTATAFLPQVGVWMRGRADGCGDSLGAAAELS